jgi:hypothetical protein
MLALTSWHFSSYFLEHVVKDSFRVALRIAFGAHFAFNDLIPLVIIKLE